MSKILDSDSMETSSHEIAMDSLLDIGLDSTIVRDLRLFERLMAPSNDSKALGLNLSVIYEGSESIIVELPPAPTDNE